MSELYSNPLDGYENESTARSAQELTSEKAIEEFQKSQEIEDSDSYLSIHAVREFGLSMTNTVELSDLFKETERAEPVHLTVRSVTQKPSNLDLSLFRMLSQDMVFMAASGYYLDGLSKIHSYLNAVIDPFFLNLMPKEIDYRGKNVDPNLDPPSSQSSASFTPRPMSSYAVCTMTGPNTRVSAGFEVKNFAGCRILGDDSESELHCLSGNMDYEKFKFNYNLLDN